MKEYGMVRSMNRKRDCWGNVPTEKIFFNRLKNDGVHGTRYRTGRSGN
jgi:hypothetical protein